MTNTTIELLGVLHIMKDGERRDSVEGISPQEETGCYRVLKAIRRKEAGNEESHQNRIDSDLHNGDDHDRIESSSA